MRALTKIQVIALILSPLYGDDGVLWFKEVTPGNCCAAQTSSYNKRNDVSVAQQFHVLIPVAMST